jgi:large subunit ribosomal protein L15
LGRGGGSGSGNYSGKGMKGQRARSGGKNKGGFAGKKFPAFIAQIPKKRGFRSFHERLNVVNLDQINQIFKSGETVDPNRLFLAGLVSKIKPGVKILGRGQITKKLIVKADSFSKSAFDAIKKAGGEAMIIQREDKKQSKLKKK